MYFSLMSNVGQRGVLFIMVIQGSRLTEKSPFYDATFSNLGFWVVVVREENLEKRALTLRLFHPEGAHITSVLISLFKVRHMAFPNFKGCVPGGEN